MSDLPEPLTPADCDLRDFQYMPLDVSRLRGSELASTESPEACWAALMLWSASWHEVPAASLCDDERVLAKAAGYGRDIKGWRKVSAAALRGFQKASDGRFYHPVVAVKALEAWLEKLAQRMSGGEGNAKRWGTEFDKVEIVASARIAAERLRALDPKSRTLLKRFVASLPKSEIVAPVGSPNGSPVGTPGGIPLGVPLGSQGKGREGKEETHTPGLDSELNRSAAPPGPVREKSDRERLAARVATAIGVQKIGDLPPNVAGNLMAEVDSMLAQNCDFVADIAPALATRPDGKWPGNPRYWTKAALGNRDRRLANPAPAGHGKTANLHRSERDKRLRSWAKSRQWSATWGPQPGEPGCCLTEAEIAGATTREVA